MEDRYVIELARPDGILDVPVRMPTADEWVTFLKANKTVRQSLGRGRSVQETRSCGPEALLLYGAIRQGGAPDLDEFEALELVSALGDARIGEVEREAGRLAVEVTTRAGRQRVEARIPTARERHEYRTSALRVLHLKNGQEYRPNPRAAVELLAAIAPDVSLMVPAAVLVASAFMQELESRDEIEQDPF